MAAISQNASGMKIPVNGRRMRCRSARRLEMLFSAAQQRRRRATATVIEETCVERRMTETGMEKPGEALHQMSSGKIEYVRAQHTKKVDGMADGDDG